MALVDRSLELEFQRFQVKRAFKVIDYLLLPFSKETNLKT